MVADRGSELIEDALIYGPAGISYFSAIIINEGHILIFVETSTDAGKFTNGRDADAIHFQYEGLTRCEGQGGQREEAHGRRHR